MSENKIISIHLEGNGLYRCYQDTAMRILREYHTAGRAPEEAREEVIERVPEVDWSNLGVLDAFIVLGDFADCI